MSDDERRSIDRTEAIERERLGRAERMIEYQRERERKRDLRHLHELHTLSATYVKTPNDTWMIRLNIPVLGSGWLTTADARELRDVLNAALDEAGAADAG